LKSLDGSPGHDRFEYDERGLLHHIHYASGASELFEHDALARLVRYVPLDGVPIDLQYDDEGRLSADVRAQLRTSGGYQVAGRTARTRDPLGQQLTFEYDGASRVQAIVDSDGNRIELELDAAGRPRRTRLRNADGSISQERATWPEERPAPARQLTPDGLSFVRLPS